jgi:hypothetical protein
VSISNIALPIKLPIIMAMSKLKYAYLTARNHKKSIFLFENLNEKKAGL